MAVQWQTSESEQAETHASEDRYETAARRMARSAYTRFREFGLNLLGSNGNLAVGDLLYAICYARQAGADETAVHLRGTLESYTRATRECAHQRLGDEWPSMTWACLVGLCEEWVGDAYLLTRDGRAGRYYGRAKLWYRLEDCREEQLGRDSPAPCWQWGHEPEFDKVWGAFERYVDWLGTGEVEAPDTTDFGVYTFERLAYKRRLLSATA